MTAGSSTRTISLLTFLATCASCANETHCGTDAAVDSGCDTDTDADTGADTGTGSDTDSDLDSGTDTDSDTDSDADSGTDTDSPGACGDSCCNAPAPHFPLPTAVTDDPLYVRTEPLPGEPIVEDPITGAYWQGCAAGMSGDIATCDGVALSMTWPDALAYCDTLSWAGDEDWYLPDPWEANSILDYGTWSPAVAAAAFDATPADRFWTSATRVGDASEAWFVSTINGLMACAPKEDVLYVRCVRGDDENVPQERFVRIADVDNQPVVEDYATGLMWQGCAAGMDGDLTGCVGSPLSGLPTTGAAYCAVLTWGSYSDWRLPDVRELLSIVDFRSKTDICIDESAFPDTPYEPVFWASSPFAPEPAIWQWQLDYLNGCLGLDELTRFAHGLCVRDLD